MSAPAPFGDLLRRHRRAAGLTQEELAERAGLSVDAVGTLERGARRAPRKDSVALLADALGLAGEERAALESAARSASVPAASRPSAQSTDGATGDTDVAARLPSGTVTFLFTDIEGSTRLLQHLGAGRYADALAEHRRLLRAAFAAHGGREVDSQGDGFFVAFARAADAVAAAAEATRALAEHAWPPGVSVQVRVGLHTGAPQLAGDRYVGLDMHRAARIAAAGHGGQVLLSAATRDLAEDILPRGAALRDLGEHRLKDLQRPERLSQLVLDGLPADFPRSRRSTAIPTICPSSRHRCSAASARWPRCARSYGLMTCGWSR